MISNDLRNFREKEHPLKDSKISKTVLLAIIFLTFVGIGLPNAVLGVAWPNIQIELDIDYSSIGILSIAITGSMVISSYLSGTFIKRTINTGVISGISVVLISISLLGFWRLSQFYLLIISSMILGLSTGVVDASINNYVALYYNSSQMNWLHCFWGVGAFFGPIIMSFYMKQYSAWRIGYFTIALILLVLAVLLFRTRNYWKLFDYNECEDRNKQTQNKSIFFLLHISGVKASLIAFFTYCALQVTVSLWASSYLVKYKQMLPHIAALLVSMFFVGITLGRFVSGFIALKINNKVLIRIALIIVVVGVLLFIVSASYYLSVIGLMLIGIGCAPVFPCMIKETPMRFGEDFSKSIIGLQMAFAYLGSSIMPPLFGTVLSKLDIIVFPYILLGYAFIMILATEIGNVQLKTHA